MCPGFESGDSYDFFFFFWFFNLFFFCFFFVFFFCFFVIIITVQICKFNITVSTQFLLLYYSLWCPGLQRLQRFDLVVEQTWYDENLLSGILVELQDFCRKNYTKVVSGFQKFLNNSRFRQNPVLNPVLHKYLAVRRPLMEKSYFAQNWSYSVFEVSGWNWDVNLPTKFHEISSLPL